MKVLLLLCIVSFLLANTVLSAQWVPGNFHSNPATKQLFQQYERAGYVNEAGSYASIKKRIPSNLKLAQGDVNHHVAIVPNHMPAASALKKAGQSGATGCVLSMLKSDEDLLASSSTNPKQYTQKQGALMNRGKFYRALWNEIKDVARFTGGRYKTGLKQLIDCQARKGNISGNHATAMKAAVDRDLMYHT